MVFFHEDENKGDQLFIQLLSLSDRKNLEDVIRESDTSDAIASSEMDRFHLSVLIHNLTIAICWINLIEKRQGSREKIIKGMLDAFTKRVVQQGGYSVNVRIGDYVIDPSEMAALRSKLGENLTEDTLTGWGSLARSVFDLRVQDYSSAFNERSVDHIGLATDPVARVFARNITGKSCEDNPRLAVFLSALLVGYDNIIGKTIAGIL